MAAKSIVDMAIERLNTQIADLVRARELIIEASGGNDPAPADKPKRTRGKGKKGLPTSGWAPTATQAEQA